METSSRFASGRNSGQPDGRADASAPLPSRGRFGRKARLVRESDFQEAFDAGESVPGRTLVLWVRRQPDAARRLGVIASKRTFHHAVERNRAKRLLRESFRLHRHCIVEGIDLVLLARRRILDGGRAEVDRDLLAALRKKGLLRAECTMLNAQCSMHNAQRRMLNVPCRLTTGNGERETATDP